jgi:hypothetical protein
MRKLKLIKTEGQATDDGTMHDMKDGKILVLNMPDFADSECWADAHKLAVELTRKHPDATVVLRPAGSTFEVFETE